VYDKLQLVLKSRIDKLKFVQHQIAADETLRAGQQPDPEWVQANPASSKGDEQNDS
jgi:hypothetical protein